jgi:hypothetical protein
MDKSETASAQAFRLLDAMLVISYAPVALKLIKNYNNIPEVMKTLAQVARIYRRSQLSSRA